MAKTPNLQITLLEVGQNDKELTINQAISTIDTAIGNFSSTGYLGEFSSAPSSTGLEPGSSYFDLTFNVFKTLNTSGTWVTSSGGSGGTGSIEQVTATAPVISSGGTTPNISIPAATASVSGYLTNSDWSTFNGKQAALGFTPYNSTNPAGYTSNTGTVTSVSVTANNGITQSIATGTTTPAITLGLGDITPNKITINQATGSDGLVFANGSKIRLAGNSDATIPYFQSSVTDMLTSVRAYGNGTGNAEFVAIAGSDLVNNNGIVMFCRPDGTGLYNFHNGTGNTTDMWFTQGTIGTSSITIKADGKVEMPFDLKLTGAGSAFMGDFSNSTAANRNVIKTSLSNGDTRVSIVPNGSSVISNLNVENSSSMTNSALVNLFANSSEVGISGAVRGSGTALPFTIYHTGTKVVNVGGTNKTFTHLTELDISSGLTLSTSAGTAGQVLTSNGSGVPTWSSVPKYLGEATSDPSSSGQSAGSTYYNTSTSKLRVLLSTASWVDAA